MTAEFCGAVGASPHIPGTLHASTGFHPPPLGRARRRLLTEARLAPTRRRLVLPEENRAAGGPTELRRRGARLAHDRAAFPAAPGQQAILPRNVVCLGL